MSGLERLRKLKGYHNSFVMHSNNPLASAAAMGLMSGRSREAGPYFRLRTQPISDIGANAPQANGTEQYSAEVDVDLKRDWKDFMKQHAQSLVLKFDESPTLQRQTMHYLNTVRRLPAPRKRVVHESRELVIPEKHQEDYLALKEVIRSGANLRPYLSRNVQDDDIVLRTDKLLNAWDIHHLHFLPTGSDHIVLCKITDDDVFMIQAADHTGSHRELWIDTDLLRIAHESWLESLADCKLCVSSVTPSIDDRLVVRQNNANFTATMPDGTVYLGRGLTASGECIEDWDNCRKIFDELAHFERLVRDNARQFRAALKWHDSTQLSIRMVFEGRDCFFYEPTARTEIHLRM